MPTTYKKTLMCCSFALLGILLLATMGHSESTRADIINNTLDLVENRLSPSSGHSSQYHSTQPSFTYEYTYETYSDFDQDVDTEPDYASEGYTPWDDELDKWEYAKAEETSSDNHDIEEYAYPSENNFMDDSDSDDQEKKKENYKVSGEIHMGFGIDSDHDFIWRRANYDLNETILNFRSLSGDQLNQKENTYDPAIYQRLRVEVDGKSDDSKVKVHSNFDFSPWSVVGKTKKVTLTGAGGDQVEVELLYAGNTGYTVNQNFPTLQNGDSLIAPELKVVDGKIPATTLTSSFGNTFSLPELKIDYKLEPIRELWFDYAPNKDFSLRVFPYALHDQAPTTDDPLHLSNNKMFWEESPWLSSWQQGNFNSGANDFTKGGWDDSLVFYNRDSTSDFLSTLRGVSFQYSGIEDTTIEGTVATPKTLWQDYGQITAIPASLRVKHFLDDNSYIGTVTNAHWGFNDDENLAATNYVWSVDGGIVFDDVWKLEGQVSTSRTKQDIDNSDYDSRKRGNAYYVSLTKTSIPHDELITTDYWHTAEHVEPQNFHKTKLYYAHMDEGFESSLANYHETRKDTFWGRHLYFTPMPDTFFAEGRGRLAFYDFKPFAFGNGIDYGRYVVGLTNETAFLDGQLESENNIRNVHKAHSHKYVETVVRSEWTYKATDKLTTKFLAMHHNLPDTAANIDPFIIDSDGEPFINSNIVDDKDPSVSTLGLGAKYEIDSDWTWHGTWEYTNDFTEGTGNYPRGILNASSVTTLNEYGLTYRDGFNFLYSQTYFDAPPYAFHNVYKTGLTYAPNQKLALALDYTCNPNKFASKIDSYMNHVGFEVRYKPLNNFGVKLKYTWSRVNDLFRLVNNSEVVYETHHNIYAEARYKIQENEDFVLQYGVGAAPNTATGSYDPYGGSLQVLDTQHIVRLSYQKYF